MISQALASGTNIEALERLFALRERSERAESEKEFNRAMTDFQHLCPAVAKNKSVQFGQTKYDCATLDQITITIAPHLHECGLSFRFDSELKANSQIVTCTVHHVSGFSRQSTFTAPIDTGAKMNVMQQGASALTYARRYALLLALGIGTADMDYDGATPQSVHEENPVTQQELTRLLRRVVNHIQDRDERRKWVVGLGVTGDAQSVESWTREQFAKASDHCNEWENSGN